MAAFLNLSRLFRLEGTALKVYKKDYCCVWQFEDVCLTVHTFSEVREGGPRTMAASGLVARVLMPEDSGEPHGS